MLIGAAQCDSEKNDTLNVVIQLRTTINFETKILGKKKRGYEGSQINSCKYSEIFNA